MSARSAEFAAMWEGWIAVTTKRKVTILSADGVLGSGLARALAEAGFATELLPLGSDVDDGGLAVVDLRGNASWELLERLETRFLLVVDGAVAMRRGFELGAEDCVLGDAHPDEIAARCEAVLRRTGVRSQPGEETLSIYVDRRLWVNLGTRQVWVQGRPAKLTPREFRLLRHLIKHRDQTLGHEEILEAVWGRDGEAGRPTEVLKQYIWRLRQKIELDPNQPDTIVTDPGAGYRFVSRID